MKLYHIDHPVCYTMPPILVAYQMEREFFPYLKVVFIKDWNATEATMYVESDKGKKYPETLNADKIRKQLWEVLRQEQDVLETCQSADQCSGHFNFRVHSSPPDTNTFTWRYKKPTPLWSSPALGVQNAQEHNETQFDKFAKNVKDNLNICMRNYPVGSKEAELCRCWAVKSAMQRNPFDKVPRDTIQKWISSEQLGDTVKSMGGDTKVVEGFDTVEPMSCNTVSNSEASLPGIKFIAVVLIIIAAMCYFRKGCGN